MKEPLWQIAQSQADKILGEDSTYLISKKDWDRITRAVVKEFRKRTDAKEFRKRTDANKRKVRATKTYHCRAAYSFKCPNCGTSQELLTEHSME